MNSSGLTPKSRPGLESHMTVCPFFKKKKKSIRVNWPDSYALLCSNLTPTCHTCESESKHPTLTMRGSGSSQIFLALLG